MQTVDLQLPEEILSDLVLQTDTVRGPGDLTVLIDGISVASSLVTLASLRQALPALARRIRSWRADSHEAAAPPVLVIRAPGLYLEVPLPSNVSAQTIVEAVAKVLDEGASAS